MLASWHFEWIRAMVVSGHVCGSGTDSQCRLLLSFLLETVVCQVVSLSCWRVCPFSSAPADSTFTSNQTPSLAAVTWPRYRQLRHFFFFFLLNIPFPVVQYSCHSRQLEVVVQSCSNGGFLALWVLKGDAGHCLNDVT